MAKTNYQFERRQRDLAKKRKQEEKRLRKQAAKEPKDGDGPETSADVPRSDMSESADKPPANPASKEIPS